MFKSPLCVDGYIGNCSNTQIMKLHYILTLETFSVVLMAACDTNPCFSLIGVGGYGSSHNSTVFKNSAFGIALEDGTDDNNLPYVFVAISWI